MPATTDQSPHMTVSVIELRDLKHSGKHSVDLWFFGKRMSSGFIDGYGSFKRIAFVVTFRLCSAKTLREDFWAEQYITVTVVHERTFTDDKVVGECKIPILPARTCEVKEWFPLWYNGEKRGAVKVSLKPFNIPVPAASSTVLPFKKPGHTTPSRVSEERELPILSVSSDWPA